MRNEVKEKGPSEREVMNWSTDASLIKPVLADGDKMTTGDDKHGRTQRQTMALRDVRYRLTARILTWDDAPKHRVAYDEMFQRRVDRGTKLYSTVLGAAEEFSGRGGGRLA